MSFAATSRRISRNKLKLLGVSIFSFILLLSPPFIVNYIWFQMPVIIPTVVVLIPFLSLLNCIIWHGAKSNCLGTLVYVKYYKFFPVLFYYDPKPESYRFKKLSDLKPLIQPGDIILRKHDSYLDGLILSQTSYFTHVGIFYGDHNNKVDQIIHSTGQGVDFDDLTDFVRCDDVLVLRMNKSKIESFMPNRDMEYLPSLMPTKKLTTALFDFIFEPKGRGSIFNNNIVIVNNVRSFMLEQLIDKSAEVQNIGKKQLEIYDYFTDPHHRTTNPIRISKEKIIQVVLKQAELLRGKKYDFDFNFINFKRLSCVEFVWYCYKSVFPIHSISRDLLDYFYFIRTFILVPDMFVEDALFDVIYFSGNFFSPETDSITIIKKRLMERHIKISVHFLKILGCQMLILILVLCSIHFYKYIILNFI